MAWKVLPSAELVPGDLVKLSLGAVVAADVKIVDGSVLLDQSMLTGESVPVESGAGVETYAGALVRRGEATAELVRTAHVVSSQQKAVLHVVRNLAIFNGVIIVGLISYATFHGLPWSETIPLLLTAVLAAIPVALPATFTLATALGARSLARVGVLSTRLSAVDEAATMDVLCSDKTGTLTRNELSVTSVRPLPCNSPARPSNAFEVPLNRRASKIRRSSSNSYRSTRPGRCRRPWPPPETVRVYGS